MDKNRLDKIRERYEELDNTAVKNRDIAFAISLYGAYRKDVPELLDYIEQLTSERDAAIEDMRTVDRRGYPF